MTRKIVGLGVVPMLLALLSALLCVALPAPARAQSYNVNCSYTAPPTMNFGSGLTATGSANFFCENWGSAPANITLCLGRGTQSDISPMPSQPVLRNTSTWPNPTISFNLYSNAARTQAWTVSTPPLSMPLSIPAAGGSPYASGKASGTIYFGGSIPSGHGQPAGPYSANFYNTILGIFAAGSCQSSATGFSGTNGTFIVNATVGNNCSVAAVDANFGELPATATNLATTTTISVTCPTGTPYTIGLKPSNDNAAGAGVLSGTGSNLDKPPYQLRRTSTSGPIWGNTAAVGNAGNGVGATGTGAPQSFPVHVTVPSADYTPDDYSDTVTVTVHF